MNVPTFVDIQGFKSDTNEFFVKELAIFQNGNRVQCFIFAPPFAKKKLSKAELKQIKWLTQNHHGFEWDDGAVPYSHLQECAASCLKDSIHGSVYVKGIEKEKWLKKLYPSVNPINIEVLNKDHDLPNLPTKSRHIQDGWMDKHIACIAHNGACAMRNVSILKEWWLKKRKEEDEELCMEHYNRPGDDTHIDGPPPKKKNCYICLKTRNI